ncbi:MAG: hypothetical protein CO183_02070 [Candidatus Zambryskibacteria bacterium CG_4_9_14_3_um_filter_42_9]|uniref:Uncharacterized protein n=1 Tax=Candidatus Zambryskibacteria bacterium CG22_combo_CG10-13_8_21_14_all_42_17 TaxID=1975118 RepID=A0A2H0BD70_9BACT|nr:MAG: hypothetical protein COX06_02520 [Candidatus Zambryskibacteria bacterium CG22_combo_CG10-13_8_21_14_all_42_17]PJA36711.1 MAG: hypothetical protein CO183_02070 [Candidatus Zambryskibacteria bacterium CG_4_9_14_3_um_filter_42_9]
MSLTFTPKILRYANLYFFIQNLSEWHFSNRKDHNEAWRNELLFSTEAESCIQEFKKIHQQYSFGDKYLGRPFFLYKDPWPTVELLVGKDDGAKIKNIFATLEPYFDTIYIKDEVMLKTWRAIIAKPEFVTNASYINNTLANFYGCAPYNENCTIYLLLSTEKKNGGTAGTISNNAITLELSRTSIKLEKHMFNVLWHELIHLYFKNCLFFPLLEKCTDSDWEIMGKIDELVASSLLPNGLLKHNTLSSVEESGTPGYFNARINSENKIINIKKLIYPYLRREKMVDINLVQELYKMELGDK